MIGVHSLTHNTIKCQSSLIVNKKGDAISLLKFSKCKNDECLLTELYFFDKYQS